jgi:hypothetical protein
VVTPPEVRTSFLIFDDQRRRSLAEKRCDTLSEWATLKIAGLAAVPIGVGEKPAVLRPAVPACAGEAHEHGSGLRLQAVSVDHSSRC